jgi:hypothetical protein
MATVLSSKWRTSASHHDNACLSDIFGQTAHGNRSRPALHNYSPKRLNPDFQSEQPKHWQKRGWRLDYFF